MPDEDTDTHTEGTQRAEDLEEPTPETDGAQRPVGQVDGDLMEPNNSGSGTA